VKKIGLKNKTELVPPGDTGRTGPPCSRMLQSEWQHLEKWRRYRVTVDNYAVLPSFIVSGKLLRDL
jgi:hypothetical protein